MLKLACIVAAIAGFGLIVSAVAALTAYSPGGTLAGALAAVSAGLLVAVAWTALILTFYQRRTAPDDDEEEEEEEEGEEKPSSSKR